MGHGRDRGDDAKITIGHCLGSPIALASSNDLLGLTIAEGIEDALNAHQATGMGGWWRRMDGSAGRHGADLDQHHHRPGRRRR